MARLASIDWWIVVIGELCQPGRQKTFPQEGRLTRSGSRRGGPRPLGGDGAPGSAAAYEQRILGQYAETARGDDAIFPRVGLVGAFPLLEAVQRSLPEP